MTMDMLKAVKISDSVYWVGAVDWNLREFHGYTTHRGSTYNAYLIMDKHVTLVDTVKKQHMDEMTARIKSVVDLKKIDYIISNHAEMDHSGCLVETARVIEPDMIYASVTGAKSLGEHFHDALKVTPVQDGESLSLGKNNVRFIETKMVHWPDSMFTYLKGEAVLFSQDGFGMHLASNGRFEDEVERGVIDYETATYFANILMPLTVPVKKALDKVTALGVPLKIIAPDHGPVWRKPERIKDILAAYNRWTEQLPTEKAVIIYDTMWESTHKLAKAVYEGLIDAGAKAVLLPLSAVHRSDVALEVFDAGAVIVGSPTINNTIFPTVADAMCYLRGLKPKNKIGAAFGSFGWSGESVKILDQMLGDMGIERVCDSVRVKYVPDHNGFQKAFDVGRTVGKAVKERARDTSHVRV